MTFKTTNRSKRLNAAGIRSICGHPAPWLKLQTRCASFPRAFSLLEHRFPKLRPHSFPPPAASRSRFSTEQRDARWNDELFPWILRVLATWVQRRKHVAIERVAEGIHIELETQDDLGYYRYMFDVFPLRELRKARR